MVDLNTERTFELYEYKQKQKRQGQSTGRNYRNFFQYKHHWNIIS